MSVILCNFAAQSWLMHMKEVISYDQKRKIVGAIVGPLCALLVWLLPIEGLTAVQHRLLAIMSLVAC